MAYTYTRTYATLEVAQSTIDDIKRRLLAATNEEAARRYEGEDGGVVLPDIMLIPEAKVDGSKPHGFEPLDPSKVQPGWGLSDNPPCVHCGNAKGDPLHP